jgi:hypothetical protein
VIHELDEEHDIALTVLGDLQELRDRIESRAASQRGGDLLSRQAPERSDLDLARRKRVAAPDLDARLLPDAYAARDLAALDEWPEALRELHASYLLGSFDRT